MDKPNLMVDSQIICSICGERGGDHNLDKHKQVIDRMQGRESEAKKSQPSHEPRLPRDPLLRGLLIRKGIVTTDELLEIEKEVLASGGVIVGGASRGEDA